MGRPYKTFIPRNAVELVIRRHPNGVADTADLRVKGKLVGRRFWDDTGVVCREFGCTHEGRPTGPELLFHADGSLMAVVPWRNGVLDGTGAQWSRNGRLIVEWTLTKGTGVELLCADLTGQEDGEFPDVPAGDPVLSIERHWHKDKRHGVEREWTDNVRVRAEVFYYHGLLHGISRLWELSNELSPGFPQYFILGEEVTQAHYGERALEDRTLPADRGSDDANSRELPEEFVVQVGKCRKRREQHGCPEEREGAD